MSKLTTKNSFGVFPILFIKKNNKISATINSDIIPPLKDIKKCVYALSELFGEIKEMGENGREAILKNYIFEEHVGKPFIKMFEELI